MSDQDYENTIAHLDERIAELRMEIIAATGQAQTALEENAKLREEREILLAALEFMQSDRDAWQAAHNALLEEEGV